MSEGSGPRSSEPNENTHVVTGTVTHAGAVGTPGWGGYVQISSVNIHHSVNGVPVGVNVPVGMSAPVVQRGFAPSAPEVDVFASSPRTVGIVAVGAGVVGAVGCVSAVVLLGAPVFVLAALVPTAVLCVGGLVFAARAGHLGGVQERDVLAAAEARGGDLTPVALARHTGRPIAECQKALDAIACAGWATIENDATTGQVVYRFAELGSRGLAPEARNRF